MNVQKIVETYLKANGYDGLVDWDGECGCELIDLIPCLGPCEMCEPAYRGPDPSGESAWLMYTSKVAAKVATQATSEVPCVRHRSGWCATASGKGFNPACGSVKTKCGYYVYLPGGSGRRLPDCPECLERLRMGQSK